MRIYSDQLGTGDLYATMQEIRGMYIQAIQRIRRPKVRSRGWEVVTASYTSNRWKNSGRYGASGVNAASRDDHGRWFAMLFGMDPKARICEYTSAEDFHARTDNKYAALV